MSVEFRDYPYSSAGPGSPYERRLAHVFVTLVQSFQGIENICDLGSGNGHLASQFGAFGHRVVGIDASISGTALAKANYESSKVCFFRSEIRPDLVLAQTGSERFDAVVSSDVIEHLYRPSDLVETAAALLKPGGIFIVGTPYHGYVKNITLGVLNKWDAHHTVDWDGGHIKFFSVNTLEALVLRCGFGNTDFHFYGRFPWLWKNMICVARKVA